MGGLASSAGIAEENIYTEKTNLIFKSEDQLSNMEKNIILNFNKLQTNHFSNIFLFFCCDFSHFQNLKATNETFKESLGEKFVEFINFSDYFKKTNEEPKTLPINELKNTNSKSEVELKLKSTIDKQIIDYYYDAHKLRLLIFLITKENYVTNNDYYYNDRVSFDIYLIKNFLQNLIILLLMLLIINYFIFICEAN